ncbi:FAR1-related sequence 5-like protein [Tanacetum coccineum]
MHFVPSKNLTLTNEENLQAHAVNISKHEDVIEDIPMEEASSDESTTEDESGDEEECPARHVGILDVTPRGSKYWIPDVEDKPLEGTIFESIQYAYQVYKEYATKGGFEIKRGGQHNDVRVRGLKKAKTKYFYCVREGRKAQKLIVKETNNNNEKKQRRRRSSCRIGFQAKLVIKLINGNQYVVDKFVQRHNHYLISSLNMGPVRVFKLMKEMYGGFENIGATTTDCKNERRDMNVFVDEDDAQMAVDKLLSKQEFLHDFFVRYKTDENDALTGLFWADEEAKRNYLCFGDVVSFDATYRSNKVGLIARETSKSYKWLLKSFKQAFRRAPKVFVTDQYATIKKAIAKSNNSFKRQICDIVWTHKISPEVFEEKWASIITEFNMQENKWLYDMYQMRDKWIPAYLHDEPMAGLMRTSSRYMHHKNDHDTMYTTPDLRTNLQIEKEAAELYTSTIFLDVQDKIYASLESCHSVNVTQIDDTKRFVIHDLVDDVIANHVSDVEENEINYEVEYNKIDESVTCSCKRFESYGILCRHIFYVLRMMKINEFPKKYLLRRWSRDALPPISEDSLNKMRYLMTKADVDVPIPQEMDKEEMYSSALGVTKPKKVKIKCPSGIRNKGTEGKRIPSAGEVGTSRSSKRKRRCSYYQLPGHDIRICPAKKKKEAELAKEAESARFGTQPEETLNE